MVWLEVMNYSYVWVMADRRLAWYQSIFENHLNAFAVIFFLRVFVNP